MTTEQIQQIQTAVALQKAGRLAEAAKIYSRVLRRAPDNFDCVYLLATLHAQQGDLSKAIELFRRAAKLRPDVLDVQYNLAVALGMTGDHREAAHAYKRILDKDPRHSQARNNYAACLLSDNQLTEALQQYDTLIASHPDHADAYNNRGMALQYLKRLDEALHNYDQAIALRPRFPQSHVNRGNVLAMLHRPDEALESFKKAIALQPDFADAYSNAGNIYSTRRSYGEALGAYDRALELRPDDSETRSMRLLAKMYLCDWSNFNAECQSLLDAVNAELPVYPFSILPVSTAPAEQYRCATIFTKTRYPGLRRRRGPARSPSTTVCASAMSRPIFANTRCPISPPACSNVTIKCDLASPPYRSGRTTARRCAGVCKTPSTSLSTPARYATTRSRRASKTPK